MSDHSGPIALITQGTLLLVSEIVKELDPFMELSVHIGSLCTCVIYVIINRKKLRQWWNEIMNKESKAPAEPMQDNEHEEPPEL